MSRAPRQRTATWYACLAVKTCHGCTMAQIAEAIGINPVCLSQYASGARKTPESLAATLHRMSKGYWPNDDVIPNRKRRIDGSPD